jgi:hypothetical protein
VTRIFVTTAGDEPYHRAQREAFLGLADADVVGAHQPATDPGDADAILFVDLHQHPGDTFLRTLRTHPLVAAYRDKVFVYDERDFPFFTFPGIYVGGTLAMARRFPISGGPYPAFPGPAERAARTPDLLYSFRGARTHAVRDKLFELEHPRGHTEYAGGADFFASDMRPSRSSEAELERARRRYTELTARSKFVLCPRGQGPSSFRLYETLAAGRVPVVISDQWLAPPRVDWDACVVRVAERDAHRVPRILEESEPAWRAMVSAGEDVWRKHFARNRLWHSYATSLLDLSLRRRAPKTPWWMQKRVLHLEGRRSRAGLRARLRG